MAKAPQSPIGVLSFPHLFKPRAPNPGADERYSCVLIFDQNAQASPEYKAMKKAVLDAAVAKWGDKAIAGLQSGKLRSPFRDASEKEFAGYEPGYTFISPWSKQKPDVIDGRLNDVVASDVYPGALARITYNAFAYSNNGNSGVSIGLNNIQIVNFTTPRLDSKRKGSDDFDSIDMDDKVGAGDDDDLPF